jgi:endoglucanase
MEQVPKEFFAELLSTPGVSGYEQPVQRVVRRYAESFADEIKIDVHGNLLLAVNPQAAVRVMYAGHADQIGLIVSHVDENGFLYVQTVGGWDPQQLVGSRLSIWTESGPINGVIARKPIHLLEESERNQVVKIKELWVDIGAANREQALSVVGIGDPVTFQLGYQELQNRLVNGPAVDDRCGVWVVVEALRRAKEMGIECGLFAVSTVQEEVGLRGAKTAAFGIDPQIGIAVDVTHASDCPTIDQRQQGEVKLGKGPVIVRGPNVNPRIAERLFEVAEDNEIPFQRSALGRAAPNDSNPIQVNRCGVATGILAIPNRYMHSCVETISLDDINQAAMLLAHFAKSIDPSSSDWLMP